MLPIQKRLLALAVDRLVVHVPVFELRRVHACGYTLTISHTCTLRLSLKAVAVGVLG